MITILQDISANIAAFGYNPVRASSDRFEETRTVEDVTGASDSTGNLRIGVADGSNYKAGDTITVRGATGVRSAINGRHNVTAVSTNDLTTDTPWPGAIASGDWGECERTNDNFALRLDMTIGTEVYSVYRYPGKIGAVVQCAFDVRGFEFAREFVVTGTVHNLEVLEVGMELVETYMDKDYAMKDGDDEDLNSGTDVLVYRAAELRLIEAATKKDFTIHDVILRRGVKLPVCFMAKVPGASYKIINKAAKVDVTDTTGSVLRWITPVQGTVLLKDSTETHTLAEMNVYIDERCYDNAVTLFFLNRYGGFDPYDFVDVEHEQESDKSKYHSRADIAANDDLAVAVHWTHNRKRMTGRSAARSQVEHLRDLVSSAEVYDGEGRRVYVVTRNIRTYGDEVIPEVVIEYRNEECISY